MGCGGGGSFFSSTTGSGSDPAATTVFLGLLPFSFSADLGVTGGGFIGDGSESLRFFKLSITGFFPPLALSSCFCFFSFFCLID